MKRILIFCLTLLAALSCIKDGPDGSSASDVITFAPYIIQTKAEGYVNSNDDFRGMGRMVIYDYISAMGNQDYPNGIQGYYMDGVSLVCSAEGGWNYTSDTPAAREFVWIDQSYNTFYGWLDMTGSWFDGVELPSFRKSEMVLSVPEITFTSSSPVYDFMYTEVVERYYEKSPADGGNPDSGPVALPMRHLFTAFSIGAENNQESDIQIETFEIVNLYNTASATISFNGSDPQVDYADYRQVYSDDNPSHIYKQMTATPYKLYGGAEARNAGTHKTGNIFSGAQQERTYNIMWPPENLDQIHSTDLPTETDDGTTVYPTDWRMYIRYSADGHEFEKRLNFPAILWEAGKRYHFDVTFADKMIDLKVQVNPWEYDKQEIDYSNEGVAVTDNHTLRWDVNTYSSGSDPSLRYAYIKNGMPVEGTFQLEAPMGGTWLATLTGDIDAFDIYPSSGVIDGNAAIIKVAPKPGVLGLQRDFKVKVKFAVRRPDGRTISADSVLQPAGTEYTIILSAN